MDLIGSHRFRGVCGGGQGHVALDHQHTDAFSGTAATRELSEAYLTSA